MVGGEGSDSDDLVAWKKEEWDEVESRPVESEGGGSKDSQET